MHFLSTSLLIPLTMFFHFLDIFHLHYSILFLPCHPPSIKSESFRSLERKCLISGKGTLVFYSVTLESHRANVGE